MKWHDILKSKYDLKDIDLRTFERAGSNMKYFLDKYKDEPRAKYQIAQVWKRLILSIFKHEKMDGKDRTIFMRVAGARGTTQEQSQKYYNISLSGSKIIKPMFPIPLDLEWGTNLHYDIYDEKRTKVVLGQLKINTEGTELIIKEIKIPIYRMTLLVTKVISLKKPDRELSNFISNLQKDGKVLLKVTTDMKYKNGTKIKIKPYLQQFPLSAKGRDYGKIMAAIRRDAVIGEPERTLFEERVEEEKLSQRDDLWVELRDTYMEPYYDVYGRREEKE